MTIMTEVYPSTLPDDRFCIQDLVYLTNDHRTSKMQVWVQRGNCEFHFCDPRAEPLETFPVLMFKYV